MLEKEIKNIYGKTSSISSHGWRRLDRQRQW